MKKSVLFATAAFSVCMPALAHAAAADQDQPAVSAAADDGAIVVTARRRAESIQNVPTSIIAFDQNTLTEKAVSNIFDLNKAVPGLTVANSGNNASIPNFIIRGRGQNFGAASGSVETYFADIPLSSPFNKPQLPPQLFDLQSVSVVKGPQGTLFGRNTTGGAVVIVPQAPTDTLGGYARVQGGNYSNIQAEAAINIPIVAEKVLLRVAGFISKRDGYVRVIGGFPSSSDPTKLTPASDAMNRDTKEVRATLLITPTDTLTNSTIVTYHYDKTRYTASHGWNLFGPNVIAGSTLVKTLPGQPSVYLTPGAYGYDVRTTVDISKQQPTDTWAIINTTTLDLSDNLKVKNIFGYIDAKGYPGSSGDTDATLQLATIDLPAPAYRARNKQLTDELQFQAALFDNRLNLTFGGLYDQTREPGALTEIPPTSVTVIGGSAFTPPIRYSNRWQQDELTSKALYIAGTYKVSEQLSIDAGFRHTWDSVFIKGASLTTTGFIPANATGSLPADVFTLSQKFEGNTFNIGFQYKPTPDNMIYGGFRRGYKRGGFNAGTPAQFAAFGPELLDDFFLGVKNRLNIGGMTGFFNLEGFYDKYKGQQNSFVTFGPAGNLISPTVNTPRTTYYGLDAELMLNMTPWLTLNANYSYLHSKHSTWPDTSLGVNPVTGVPFSTIDLSANPVTYSPKHKFTIAPRIHAELGSDMGELVLVPSLSYQSTSFAYPFSAQLPASTQLILNAVAAGAAAAGNPGAAACTALATGCFLNQNDFGTAQVSAYTLVDLRAEWNKVMGSKVDLAGGVTNLTDKRYIMGGVGGVLPFGSSGMVLGAPRMWYLEARIAF